MLLESLLILSCCRAVAADPLVEIDGAFHRAYAEARAGALAAQGPVLVVSGDSLLLYRGRVRVAEAVIRSPRYHRLKGLAHVPLAIRLSAGNPERLAALRGWVAALEPGAGALREASLAFLDGGGDASGLDRYCAGMEGPLEALAREAAGLELEALEKAVGAWRRDLLAADWDRVRVVVIGSHMAREGEVGWQFFTRLLGEPGEGGRLVFAEEKWDPAEALKLLATHAVDGDLGRAFFGDPGRMHRDVLAPGAKKWLDSHPIPR
ncbi:hypothetical protein [Mesoterricola silvestris]|uniref:Uncharacterized protein n=1 Tax=Mesoterricola silvestris TaxID=2927979 RepID=A0AA48GI47_9BACT|nr:hypothetical protein [Mesoterricola silvestris]BDU71424.1 hypothetical protein METEAL_05980 [Mesoterricola silvestris]